MKFKKYILVLLLLAVTVIPRLLELNSFVAVDEPAWLTRGGNFYYALGQREFQNTVYEYHPSVITMWYVATAVFVYFPEYRGLGQGYFDVDKETFDPFLLAHGKMPITLLYISRLFQVMVISLFVLLIFYFLSRLIGEKKAFLVTALMSSAPFFLGHSRLLSHEAMVAIFVLTSVFGMMAYLEHEKKWYYLVISAASAALAQLTKSSAMAMFPVIALMLAISVFEKMRERGFKSALVDHLKTFVLWFAALALVYFILWPGMWVAPGKMLYEVYGNAFSYALQGSRLQVTQELQPSTFSLASAGGTIWSFAKSITWRATPLSWAGILLACIFLFVRGDDKFFTIFKKMVFYLFVTALMFILLFSFAQGRNSSHYIMTSHVSMDAIAALGWCSLLGWWGMKRETGINSKVRPELGRRVTAGVAILLISLQLASAMAFYPYYHIYYNPIWAGITGQTFASDYGEGFEQAAAYLAQKPNAESLKVLSFRGRGPFSYFFPGQTIIL
ncbi:MAG: glycosyltransferase family 39 protein, partial [Anaerolineales bacterium]|nr:glycosyltransferase family 39 protein [Anaerolineales bacterium]